MSTELPLSGLVVALVGKGSETDRAIAVACAEAGADIALATEAESRDQDYGMNSIANEIWVIGREHFVRTLKGREQLDAFIEEATARLGRCDVLITSLESLPPLELPVLTPDGEPGVVVARLQSLVNR